MIELSRRELIHATIIAAPAIVRPASLMPIRSELKLVKLFCGDFNGTIAAKFVRCSSLLIEDDKAMMGLTMHAMAPTVRLSWGYGVEAENWVHYGALLLGEEWLTKTEADHLARMTAQHLTGPITA